MKKNARRQKLLGEILFGRTAKPITLVNQDGLEVTFTQVYAVKNRGGAYCILSPECAVEGLSPDSALVFELINDRELAAVSREKADEIFELYYRSLEGKVRV